MELFDKKRREVDRRSTYAAGLGLDPTDARMLSERRKDMGEILRHPEESVLFGHFLEKNYPHIGAAAMTRMLDSGVAPTTADITAQGEYVQKFNERMSLAEGVTARLSDEDVVKIMSAMESAGTSAGSAGAAGLFIAAIDSAPRAEAGALLRLTVKRMACEDGTSVAQVVTMLQRLKTLEIKKTSREYKAVEAKLAKVCSKYDVSASTLAPLFDPTDPEAEIKRRAYIKKQVGYIRTWTGSANRSIDRTVNAIHEMQESMDETRNQLGTFLSNTLEHRPEFLLSIQNVAAGKTLEEGQTDPAFDAQAPTGSIPELHAESDDVLATRWGSEKDAVAKSLGYADFAAAVTAAGTAPDDVRDAWFTKEEARRKRGGQGFWGRIFDNFFAPRKAALHAKLT